MTIHYSRASSTGMVACGLRDDRVERSTADLDAVDCGNCLTSRAWRNDISQRNYKGSYERFYGPGGFLDRAGQTTPQSATTAAQSRAALEQLIAGEVGKAARLGREGAGDDVIAAVVRESVRRVMAGTDVLLRLALAEDRAATAGKD